MKHGIDFLPLLRPRRLTSLTAIAASATHRRLALAVHRPPRRSLLREAQLLASDSQVRARVPVARDVKGETPTTAAAAVADYEKPQDQEWIGMMRRKTKSG